MRQTVFALFYPGCVSYDVALAAELLSRKYEIKNATADGRPLAPASGLPLSVQATFGDVDLNNCRALLLPGGDAQNAAVSADLLELLQNARAKGVFILVIGEAITFLRQAGFTLPDLTALTEMYAVGQNVLIAKAEGSIDAAAELAARLDVLDAKFVTRTKDHYRGLLGKKIRALALALIKDDQNRYLFHRMFDAKRKQTFYRPVGGGIDFHEPASAAILREIREELGYDIIVEDLVSTFENIFVIEDLKGHEMVWVFRARFKDKAVYARPELQIQESGKSVGMAVWKTLAQIKAEGSALYPVGIDSFLEV